MYMSPEQALGETIDGRSDQFSLGCVVYEMLAGVPAFKSDSPRAGLAKQLVGSAPSLRAVRPEIPLEVEHVIETTLSKTATDRYATLIDFANALDAAINRPRISLDAGGELRGRPNAGRLVSKTCDRWPQVNAFDSFLRANWKAHPRRPQLYIIHGEEGQSHDSLLERLAATTVSRFADEVEGQERGSIVRLSAPWPETDDLSIAQRDLVISLFRDADPSGHCTAHCCLPFSCTSE